MMPKIIQKQLSNEKMMEFRQLFQKWLSSDDIKKIADNHHNYHRNHVRNVLAGIRNNDLIFNEAIQLALKNKADHEKSLDEIEKSVA